MKYYRLEYNPDDNKLFHMDRGTHQIETHGWSTIDAKAEDGLAQLFIAYFKKYHTHKVWNINEVKSMWQMFINR